MALHKLYVCTGHNCSPVTEDGDPGIDDPRDFALLASIDRTLQRMSGGAYHLALAHPGNEHPVPVAEHPEVARAARLRSGA